MNARKHELTSVQRLENLFTALSQPDDDEDDSDEAIRAEAEVAGLDLDFWAAQIRAKAEAVAVAQRSARRHEAARERENAAASLAARSPEPIRPREEQLAIVRALLERRASQDVSVHFHKFEEATDEDLARLVGELRHLVEGGPVAPRKAREPLAPLPRRGTFAALRVAEALRLHHPTDVSVEDLAWECGALVSEGGPRGARATLTCVSGEAIISVAAGLAEGPRRFAVAHEMGHLVMHQAESYIGLCTGEDMQASREQKELAELEANDFAGELLMPTALSKRHFAVPQASWGAIVAFADELGVSYQAAAFRFVDHSGHAVMLVCQRDGLVLWAIKTPGFAGYVPRTRRVQPGSLGYRAHRTRVCPPDPEVVPALSWLPGAKPGATLVEHALQVPGCVLSLLWPRG